MKKAVVVFSGGQDSTTCLIYALKKYDEVFCVTFDYGQRHHLEISVACDLITRLKGVKAHKILSLSALNDLADSSLTRKEIDVAPHLESGTAAALPTTFVPGRNILFFTFAALYAHQVQATDVIAGVCETDYSGYPDCRDQFVKALNHAIQLGMAYDINFITPLMWLNKAETWALADHYKQLPLVRDYTLSCYNGIIGAGCGKCSACYLRARGLQTYLDAIENTRDALYKKGLPAMI